MNRIRQTEIDASKLGHLIIIPLFYNILELMIYCYRDILKKKSYTVGDYDEDILRNDLINSLEDNKKRVRPDLGFRSESATKDETTSRTKGRIDICVIYDLSLRAENDFTFECKRLKNTGKNHDYIKSGVMDFVSGKYAEKMPIAGMIGFIEKGMINAVCSDLKKRIEAKTTNIKGDFVFEKIQDDFDHSYKSEHVRKIRLGNIAIYHLIFDYTGIISN